MQKMQKYALKMQIIYLFIYAKIKKKCNNDIGTKTNISIKCMWSKSFQMIGCIYALIETRTKLENVWA